MWCHAEQPAEKKAKSQKIEEDRGSRTHRAAAAMEIEGEEGALLARDA